ncbi:mandelate racemase/muconate lactonizing enzyme family protein [Rhodococcus aerolatus]
MKITDIRLLRLRVPLEDPPFLAAWDPVPRRHADATVVLVETDEGVTGIGSGDTMAGFEAHAHLFVGEDPLAIGRHVRTLESIHTHGGRYWPLEVALWDLLGKVAGLPVATLLGGAADRVPAYASTGEFKGPQERAESAIVLREQGFRALKLRVDPHRAAEGLAVVTATRDAVGDTMEIMVDLNSSWRMAGDLREAPDYPAVRRLVTALAELDVCWVEEPLPYADADGFRRLRAETGVRVAAGEMQDSLTEVGRWLDDDVLDVYQMDVVLALGMSRARTVAERALLAGRRFTPHSWTNGIGVLANLAVCAGVGGGPYFEYPHDPPGWTPERRDAMLTRPLGIDGDGCVRVPDAPGLGIELDDDAVAAMAVDA